MLVPGFFFARIYGILFCKEHNKQEESAWRITAPSGAQPSANMRRRRAASLRSSHLQTARKRPWPFWSRCAPPTAPRGTTFTPTACGRATGSATPTTASLPRPPGLLRWKCCEHSGLTDLIVVVTRYFGGVLLGTGGLVRAYTTATARALENAEVVTVRSVVELEVTVDYALYERAALLIHAAGAKLADPQFTDRVTLHWQMPEGTEPLLLEQLRELTRGGAEVSVSQPFYAPF